LHRSPRPAVTRYDVSVVVSFQGTFQQQQGMFVTYDTFDAADPHGLEETTAWIGKVYVGREHQGAVVTDFDGVEPPFPRAPFALPPLLAGWTDVAQAVSKVFGTAYTPRPPFVEGYQNVFVNTQGGAYIHVEQRVGTVQPGARVAGVSMTSEPGD